MECRILPERVTLSQTMQDYSLSWFIYFTPAIFPVELRATVSLYSAPIVVAIIILIQPHSLKLLRYIILNINMSYAAKYFHSQRKNSCSKVFFRVVLVAAKYSPEIGAGLYG